MIVCCRLNRAAKYYALRVWGMPRPLHVTDDDEVRFVLDQHAKLDFYGASSLKQQSADRHVAPLGYIILISSLCSFSLMLRAYRRSNKYQFFSLWFDLTGLNPRSTQLEASMLTITHRCGSFLFNLQCEHTNGVHISFQIITRSCNLVKKLGSEESHLAWNYACGLSCTGRYMTKTSHTDKNKYLSISYVILSCLTREKN
jgi:hypothetical protein